MSLIKTIGSYASNGGNGSYAGGDGSYAPSVPPVAAPVNLIADSWQFESAFWMGASAAVDVTPGQADPFGGNHASLMENVGAASAFHQEETTPFSGLFTDSVVLSCRLKAKVGDVPDNGNLRLFNSTIGSGDGGLCRVGFVWTGTVLSAGTVSGDNTTGGVIGLGDDWYRIFVAVDVTQNKISEGWQDSDVYDIRIPLWGGDTTAGHGLHLAGVQLEPGLVPGPYLEKP